MALFEHLGAVIPAQGSDRSRSLPPFGFDRHDLITSLAHVDIDKRVQSDLRQLSQLRCVTSAGFAAWRRAVFCEQSGHDARSLTLTNETYRRKC